MRFLLQSLLKACIAIIFTSLSFAQTGKVAGKVTDGATGEGLPFVNVIIEGTNYGAASDIDGFYSIIGVPPGKYNIKASAIGYNSVTVTDARVSIDLTTKIDFQLYETSIELKEEVVVIASRPLITKDLTSSTAIVGADEIAMLPVTEFQEILQLQAGVVGGNVRGGRSGEVVYAIDGVPVTDVFDGSTVVDINANSIQELQFVSGAFNAEYGKALSGYVNIATKDGNNEFRGNISSYVGDYVSSAGDIFRGVDDINPTAIRNFEGSLSGPLIKNHVYFYTNARYIYFGGWLYGKRVFNPWDITRNNGPSVPTIERYDVDSSGDGKLVPMNWNEKIYGQGKLTWRPFSDIKLNYNFILDDVEYQDYDHSFSYNPDGILKRFRTGHTNILGLTHTLNSYTFYEVNLSYFFKRYKHYAYEDPFDERYTHPYLLNQHPAEVPSFRTGGTETSRFKRTTSTYGAKIDLTSQVTQVHMLKFGIEFNQHQLTFDNINMIPPQGIPDPPQSGDPYVRFRIPDPNNPGENFDIDIYQRKPVELSAYIQDKIELNELIINAGVRFDYFRPDGFLLNDPSDPDIYRPKRPENIYTGDTNGNGELGEGDQVKTVDERRAYWYRDAESNFQFSPRIGVAFPITDRGVIHFSYGHFFQIPNFELLYSNPEFKFGAGTTNIGIAGNPELKPQQTISGEVGVQQALTDDITIDITAYFRDIRNLAGTRNDEIRIFGGSASYSQYANSDFGYVKGIIFTLNKRFSSSWSASIDYTLQQAKGNASDPNATRNQLAGGELPEIQLIRLNWDQTHTLNTTLSFASPDNWGFSLVGQFGSGFPYTPRQSINIGALLQNSELKPSSFNVDLRAYKDFVFGDYRVSIFTRVYNLFDIRNQVNVYSSTGTADFSDEERQRLNDSEPDFLVNSVREFFRNPTFYAEPRRVELGATFFF